MDSSTQNQELSLELKTEFSHLNSSSTQEILALLTIRAPECDIENKRSPIDLVAVLDQSGSMRGKKLQMVKESMCFAISQLKSEDRLGIVLFGSTISTLFPIQKMTVENKQQAIKSVKSVNHKGSTALCEGLKRGFELFIQEQDSKLNQDQSAPTTDSVSSLLLFTDGHANIGPCKTEEVVEEMKKKREKLNKICNVFCFGYGSDHSEEMLRGISDSGEGMYYFVENEEDIASAFGDCIGGLLSVAGQNLSLKIQSLNGVMINKILGSSSSSSNDTTVNGTSYEKEIGDIYSEEEKNIICLLSVPKVEEGSTVDQEVKQEILSCELNGFNVLMKDTLHQTCSISLIRGKETIKDTEKSIKIDTHRNRLITIEALNQCRQLSDKDQLEQGKGKLLDAISLMKQSPSNSEPLTKGLIGDLEESLNDMKDKRDYKDKASKKMAMFSRSHQCERAIHSKEMYSGKSKKMEKEKFKNNVQPR